MTLRVSLDEASGFRPRSCRGKTVYVSRRGAEAEVQRLISTGEAKNPARINIYPCHQHGHPAWHIGHKSDRQTRGN